MRTHFTALALAGIAVAVIAVPSDVYASEIVDDPIVDVRVAEEGVADEGTVFIVNNHRYAVTVFAVDEAGARYRLGRLAQQDARAFRIPDGAVDPGGAALIKIYPHGQRPGLGTPSDDNLGIKTRMLVSNASQAVLWLEPDLTKSFTQMIEG